MPLISSNIIEVLETFQTLQQALAQLHESMCHTDIELPAWFTPPEGFPLPLNQSDRESAFALINQLEYLDQQEPREIWMGAGLIATSPPTLTALAAVNSAKDQFKAAMLSLKMAKIPLQDVYLNEQFDALLNKRPNIIRSSLLKMGLARLHLKQCYRRIPYFLERPTKVSWTWANTRAITRISFQEAEALLLKQASHPAVELQLNKLYTLNPTEPLARVQNLAPHLRANVVFEPSKGDQKRLMVKGAVPLFYLSEVPHLLPQIKPPGKKKGRNLNRPIRRDVKLEPTAFLPTIRVHRYQVLAEIS